MFDKEFLKTLTVMYVEDDESIRGSLSGIFKKIFGEVIICNDGNDGINQFKYYTQDRKSKIDSIISDINMPNLNGIDMVKEIRALDQEVPIIFTTAHGESSYLMEAIKLKIAYYALKPINTTELLENISKFCMAEHNKQLILKKEQEIAQYMAIMNDIASIFQIDNEGNITEANELLAEQSGYSISEMKELNISSILPEDAIVSNYDDIFKLVDNKEKYNGKIKFNTKSLSPFYLNTTILPTLNNSTAQVSGYICIGLDQTGNELEKQQTMQRVRKSIITQRSKESDLSKKINTLESQVATLSQSSVNSKDTDFIVASLNKEKQKVLSLNAQLSHYEKEVAHLTRLKNQIVTDEKSKRVDMMTKIKDMTKENTALQTKVIELQTHITHLEDKIRGKTVG